MKGGFNTSGFTIIETLIVLGITAILLLSAMYTLSGKTANGEFTQAINGIKTSLQQLINNSSSGIYPNAGNFQCSLSSTGTISLTLPSGNVQGQHYGCTFLGRMVNFNDSSLSPGTAQNYIAYTVIGQQCTTSASLFSGCSTPTSWAGTTGVGPYILPTSTKTQSTSTLLNGISLYSITLKGSNPATVTGAQIPLTNVAFLANPATASVSAPTSNILSPGALQLNVYSYRLSPVAGPMSTAFLIQQSEIDLCFASATTNQSGEIILNGTGSEAIVSLQIFGGNKC